MLSTCRENVDHAVKEFPEKKVKNNVKTVLVYRMQGTGENARAVNRMFPCQRGYAPCGDAERARDPSNSSLRVTAVLPKGKLMGSGTLAV